MGSGGGLWDGAPTPDTISRDRMNQKTLFVGDAEPASMFAGMLWFEGDQDIFHIRNGANDAWDIELDQSLLTSDIPTFAQLFVAGDPTDEMHVATKNYVDNLIGGVIDLFYDNLASDIGGIYYTMDITPTGAAETTLVKSSLGAGDDQALYNFATPSGGMGLTSLEAGVYSAHLHIGIDPIVGNRTLNVYYELYKRTAGGSETLLCTSEVSSEITTAKESIQLHATLDTDQTLNSTDRIVVKWYANVGSSGSNIDVTMYLEGDNASRTSIRASNVVLSAIFLRRDGTTALSANWNAGAYKITAKEFETSNGNIFLYSTQPKIYLYDSTPAPYPAGIATEVDNQLLDYGANYSQLGGRNTSYRGGFFRIDLRDGYTDQFFTVFDIESGGDVEVNILKLSTTGILTIGSIVTLEDKEQRNRIGRFSAAFPYSYIAPSTNSSGLIINNAGITLDVAVFENTGRFRLPTNGSAAGIQIGDDCILYRSAADTWYTTDNFTMEGDIIVANTKIRSNYPSGSMTFYTTGNIFSAAGSSNYLTQNVYHNGSDWVRMAAGISLVLKLNNASGYTFFYGTDAATPVFTAYMTLNTAGQLQLATQGPTGGLLIGTDVALYRSAANVLYSPDDIQTGTGFTAATGITVSGSSHGWIELGNSSNAGTTPYIDFHFGISGSEDYNFRIQNSANKTLLLRPLTNTGYVQIDLAQLKITRDGSDAGIQIGTDVFLYRSQAYELNITNRIMYYGDYGLIASGASTGHGVIGTNIYSLNNSSNFYTSGTHAGGYGYGFMRFTWNGLIEWYSETGNTTADAQVTPTAKMQLTNAGQLKVGTTGSGAGILIGGDVQIYRSAADLIGIPDSIAITGYIDSASYLDAATGFKLNGTEIIASDKRLSAMLFSIPSNASTVGYTTMTPEDNYLWYADKKIGWTVTCSDGPDVYTLSNVFNTSPDNNARWNASSTYPIVIEVDMGAPVHYWRLIGMCFIYDRWATSVKIEVYRTDIPEWTTLIDTSSNATNYCYAICNYSYVQKIKYTFSGYAPSQSEIAISHLFGYNYLYRGSRSLDGGGGTVYGDVSIVSDSADLSLYSTSTDPHIYWYDTSVLKMSNAYSAAGDYMYWWDSVGSKGLMQLNHSGLLTLLQTGSSAGLLISDAQIYRGKADWFYTPDSIRALQFESEFLNFKANLVYGFDYDTDADWSKTNCTLTYVGDSCAEYVTTNTDSNINRSFSFDGGNNDTIMIRYKVTAGTASTGQLFYSTGGHSYSGSYYKGFNLDNDGAWHTLVLDMRTLSAGGTDWIDNTITGIRFDLTDSNPCTILIDFIMIGGKGAGAEYYENTVIFKQNIGTTTERVQYVFADYFTTNNGTNNWTLSGTTTLTLVQNGNTRFQLDASGNQILYGNLSVNEAGATEDQDAQISLYAGSGAAYWIGYIETDQPNYRILIRPHSDVLIKPQNVGTKYLIMANSAGDFNITLASSGDLWYSGLLSSNKASSTTDCLSFYVTGDSYGRFKVDAAGLIKWGAGTSDYDVAMGRTAANVLTLYDSFNIQGTILQINESASTSTVGTLKILGRGAGSAFTTQLYTYTDGVFVIDGETSTYVDLGDNAGAYKFVVRDSDLNFVFTVDSDGKLTIGNSDTELYRAAANLLYTPDTFKAGGYQSSLGNAGITDDIAIVIEGQGTYTINVENGLITGWSYA